MLGQGKSVYQAEIDAACEAIDFLKFNAYFTSEIYKEQPHSQTGIINRIEYRPLEGFIFAITPFNFTAIASNLNMAPMVMGNTTVRERLYLRASIVRFSGSCRCHYQGGF